MSEGRDLATKREWLANVENAARTVAAPHTCAKEFQVAVGDGWLNANLSWCQVKPITA